MPVTLDVGAGDGISGPYLDVFRSNTGQDDPAEYFGYDIRPVPAPLTPHASDFSQYHEVVPDGTEFDEFGVGRVSSREFPLGLHLEPWKSFTDARQMLDYPFPTFELQDETVAEIGRLKGRGFATSAIGGSLNEWCYYLRSMSAFMLDLVDRPELAEVLLDSVTGLSAHTGAQLAEAGVDIVAFFGDVGGQYNLLISPRLWRKWFRPRWERVFNAVRRANPETKILYHSCGHILPIIPDFIELGLDILNPVQPEAMDPVAVKHRFGDRLTLWGGIGLQTTMCRTPDDVKRETRRLVAEWAPGGGAIVTVTNSLPVDIPWENVVALVETVREASREVYSRLQ
jgi:uroporphyrinogen decarboxylase